MKKISKLVLALFAVGLFAGCSNGNDDAATNALILAQLNAIIENTPDEPIERNVELSNVSEMNIVKGTTYDLSDKEGKKVFMVVMNNDDYTETVFASSGSEVSSDIYYDYKYQTENGVFYNVPFDPVCYEYNPVNTSVPFSRSAIGFDADDVEIPTTVGSHHDFHAATSDNFTNDEWASNAELKVIGDHCYVWYKEKEGINITLSKLQSMANTFDDIYEKETYIFGPNYATTYYSSSYTNQFIPTDENTKVHIIVYDLFDDYAETKRKGGGTSGYFWGLDFYKENQNWEEKICKTNKCECLHIDSYFLESAADIQRSTIAHEFQHLLHFVNKKLKNGNNIENATWFNEMMSMVCEDIMQTQIGLPDSASPRNRLNTFNSSFNKGFLRWRRGSDDVYYSYANAYAFGAYLVRNYGIDFIKALAHNNLIEKDAITNALGEVNAPDDENTFDKVYEKFYNVVFNPKSTSHTLNKEVTKTYEYATGKTNTFKCTAINLFDYVTISARYMKGDYVKNLYQASKLNDYKGPAILNNRIYNDLDESGMFVSYLGVVGTGDDQINPSFRLNNRASGNNNVIYKLVFAD